MAFHVAPCVCCKSQAKLLCEIILKRYNSNGDNGTHDNVTLGQNPQNWIDNLYSTYSWRKALNFASCLQTWMSCLIIIILAVLLQSRSHEQERYFPGFQEPLVHKIQCFREITDLSLWTPCSHVVLGCNILYMRLSFFFRGIGTTLTWIPVVEWVIWFSKAVFAGCSTAENWPKLCTKSHESDSLSTLHSVSPISLPACI